MFAKRRRSTRVSRGIASDWIQHSSLPKLESRFLASLLLTRSSTDGIAASIWDAQPVAGEPSYSPPTPPEQSYDGGDVDWTANDNGNVDGASGYSRHVKAHVQNAVIDADPSATVQKVSVAISHTDEGQLSSYSGPAASQGSPLYESRAYTNGYDGLTWDISNSDLSPLPSTLDVTVDFDASFTGVNLDNLAGAYLEVRSTFINVDVNAQGIVIADPNGTGSGITLPPGVYSPGGTVLYYDASFGQTALSSAHQNFLVTIPTYSQTTLPINLAYLSRLVSPPLEDLPPGYPDHTSFQDTFSWGLEFSVA